MTATSAVDQGSFAASVRAAATGDGRAFERLVGPLIPRLDGYLRAQVQDAADDLRSDVLLAAHSGLPRFSGSEAQFRSWVFTIAHHRIVDHRRRQRPTESLDGVDGASTGFGSDPEADALAAERAEELRAILDRLPAAQREVLLLRTVADLSIEQTAEAVGRSAGAVKLLQHRAVRSLRKIFEAIPPDGVTRNPPEGITGNPPEGVTR